MLKNRVLAATLTTIVLIAGTATLTSAQPAADTTPPAQQGGGAGGGGNRADFRERMNARLKEGLGATDDEWKVLQPKIEKVNTLRMQSFGGGMMGGGGRGRRGGGNGEGGGAGPGNDAAAQPPSETRKAAQDLRTALDDKSSSVDVIKAKLEALRQARAKAKEELTAAQKDLQSVLSVKQEAFLVMIGTLE